MHIRASRLGAGLGAIAIVVLVAFVIAPSRKPTSAATTTPAPFVLPVPVTLAAREQVPIYLEYVATTEAIRSVALQAKVTGYLMGGGAPDGSDVKQGDLLYRIDPRDYQAALDQAKAQAERDAAQREYALANAHRNQSLSKSGDVSLDSYQQATSTLQQVEASIDADKAAVETAELNLGYTEIRAPFDGRLSRIQVHDGALISAAGTQINTLVQLDPIYVTFNPPEADLAAINQAQAIGPIPVEVIVGDDAPTRFAGKLIFLDNTIDRTTDTITARAIIANPSHSLLPGQYARVRLTVGEQSNALVVPQTAVGSSQLGRFVYVVGDDGKAEQRLVTLGRTVADRVVVEKGIKDGDPVIVGNLQKIAPGEPVKALPRKGE